MVVSSRKGADAMRGGDLSAFEILIGHEEIIRNAFGSASAFRSWLYDGAACMDEGSACA